jgi:hypothetical protein
LHSASALLADCSTLSSISNMAVVVWINQDLLEVKSQSCVCALCFGVMAEPTSGCSEGHTFCKPCNDQALEKKQECPRCRLKVDQLRMRATMIAMIAIIIAMIAIIGMIAIMIAWCSFDAFAMIPIMIAMIAIMNSMYAIMIAWCS